MGKQPTYSSHYRPNTPNLTTMKVVVPTMIVPTMISLVASSLHVAAMECSAISPAGLAAVGFNDVALVDSACLKCSPEFPGGRQTTYPCSSEEPRICQGNCGYETLVEEDETLVEQDDLVCATGFVMDVLCIRRGRLLDAPSVKSLENPEKHSLHCLIDVGACVRSGFEILGEKTGATYERKYALDADGTAMVVELAKDIGQGRSCTQCTRGTRNPLGTIGDKGMQATVVGTSDGLAGARGAPPKLQLDSVYHPGVTCESALATVREARKIASAAAMEPEAVPTEGPSAVSAA